MTETFNIAVDLQVVVRMLILGFAGFALSMIITPLYTTIAYKYEFWKKGRQTTVTGAPAKIFNQLHGEKLKRNIPTMAGGIFVLAVSIVTLLFNLNRTETWLPLAAFTGAGMVGLIDDIINVKGKGLGKAGLPTKFKLLLIVLISLFCGWFFYDKLDVNSVHIPFVGAWHLGWLIVPLFVLVVVATANAVNITDGLDGLAGGLSVSAFTAYALIAFMQQRFGVAAFCLTVTGALLSYTWFNIFPARFFMGDVGAFALGTSLGVIAMITDTVAILPIIGIVFVAEAGSVILQITSKKLRNGKKIFKISPIHHHFEASGWPETKVTMRFWVVGQVAAFLGLILFVTGNYL